SGRTVIIVAGLPGPGPMAVTVPGMAAFDGSTIDTASPARTGGRPGPAGTVTMRWAVVARYGVWPGDTPWPGAACGAPTRMADGRKMTWPKPMAPVAG